MSEFVTGFLLSNLVVSTVIVIHIQVILGEEIGHVRLITLNRPRQLNVISLKVVYIYIYIYIEFKAY